MSAAFAFEHRIEFLPENSSEALREIPAAPGVFALRGADAGAEPYLTRAADLRRRLRRLLAPPEAVDEQGRPVLSRRLNLRDKVRFIEWTRTGSEFESTLLLYQAACAAFGSQQARRRLRLHPPFFLRLTLAHQHPRAYSTNRLNRRSLGEFFGPFPSRNAAERYGDAVLDLFQLRRCYEDLNPFPDHPGCVYGEMNKCLQPCKQGHAQACTPDTYAAEAQRVLAFFRSRGQSMLDEIAQQRDSASERMDFEAAAALHKQWEKVRSAGILADELVRPVSELRAIVVQEAAPKTGPEAGSGQAARSEEAALFLLENGRITGPERLSTLGVRAVREQTAVGSSLFAQPLMLSAVPLPATEAVEPASPQAPATLSPEDRARQAVDNLLQQSPVRTCCRGRTQRCSLPVSPLVLPARKAAGRRGLFAESGWLLADSTAAQRGGSRGARPTGCPRRRWIAKPYVSWCRSVKTRVLHPGREGVERIVPVLPKRKRQRVAAGDSGSSVSS